MVGKRSIRLLATLLLAVSLLVTFSGPVVAEHCEEPVADCDHDDRGDYYDGPGFDDVLNNSTSALPQPDDLLGFLDEIPTPGESLSVR